MSEYVIATASTCDLDASWLLAHDVPFVSYPFIMEKQEYADDCTHETRALVYAKMRAGANMSTSAISVYGYHSFFTSLMKQGKDVLYLDMTSAISSSLRNARQAAEMIHDEYPQRRFVFLDTCAVTSILGLLIKDVVALRDQGMSFDHLLSWIEMHKLEYNGRFMVEDLKWLVKGGRLSNASALAGSLLSIKPLILVDAEGKLVSYGKAHGRRKAMSSLLKDIETDMNENTQNSEAIVIHADAIEDAEKLKYSLLQAHPGLREVTVQELGPTITSHVGPGFLAIVVRGKNRG